MLANRVYPGLIHHRRFARNGMVPDCKLAKQLVRGLNHISAYRRKTFLSFSDWANPFAGAAGSTVMHRFRFHSGYAATHVAFELMIASIQADGLGANPTVQIDVTEAGGATTTVTRNTGFNEDGSSSTFSPNNVVNWTTKVPIDADTTYEVTVTATDYARIVSIGSHEVASNLIDEDVLFYIEDSPTLFFPIYDDMHLLLLGGLSDMWKRGGSQLFTWSGNNGAASPSFSGNTFTNIFDSTTAVAASSAGIYLGADNQTLEPHCRVSEPTEMHVVLAVHATVSSTVGGTGEIRFQDGTGTHLSFTGINAGGTWQATTTSFSDVSAFQRLDIQARTSTAANTSMELNAISLYAYVA
jgi:hypothetical protein